MSLFRIVVSPILATGLLVSTLASAEAVRSVEIRVQGQSEFDVIYSRAQTDATGAVLGGLIGAGIQASIESGNDDDLREQIEPRVHSEHWREYFLDVLNERLQSRDITAAWDRQDGRDAPDLILQLDLDTHGFRMVDTSTRFMAGFVEFKYRMYPAGSSSRERPDYQQLYMTSGEQHARETLLEDDLVLNEDLKEALRKAARRLANRIVYWRP